MQCPTSLFPTLSASQTGEKAVGFIWGGGSIYFTLHITNNYLQI